MTVKFTMKNELDPIYVDGDFIDVTNSLNMAAAAGRQFAVFDESGGGNIAFHTGNINTIRDVDDEEASMTF